jgi:hypothetical protein
VDLADILSCKDPSRKDWSADGFGRRLLFCSPREGRGGRRIMIKALKKWKVRNSRMRQLVLFSKTGGKWPQRYDLCVLPSSEEAATFFSMLGNISP